MRASGNPLNNSVAGGGLSSRTTQKSCANTAFATTPAGTLIDAEAPQAPAPAGGAFLIFTPASKQSRHSPAGERKMITWLLGIGPPVGSGVGLPPPSSCAA